jgi:signal transduction histidine kinase
MIHKRWQALSIRNKLLVMVLLPLLGVLPLLGLVLLWWSDQAFDRMLITKVRADLAVAQGYFESVLGEVDASTAAVADSHTLHMALPAADTDAGARALVALLEQARSREGLDFINLRTNDGTLRLTDRGPLADDSAALAIKALEAPTAMPDSERRGSVEVLPAEQVALLGSDLRTRIDVPLVPTRNAAPSARTKEDRAMLLLSTRAVRAIDGRLLGHVQGGLLLNRNLPFIDHINAIVYPEGSLPFGSRGTATLFLDDVRISTNVRLFDGSDRAIGTRVSQTVRDEVLGRGHTWLDRAFVVNDWYVSGYRPLVNGAGERVGMLYVGYLETPFTWLKYGMLGGIGAIFFVVMGVAAWVSLRFARSIFQPFERMEATMRRVEAGDMRSRVGPVAGGDEIALLARHFDQLLDVIDDNTRALQRGNAELDAKVAQRTAELQTAQAQLLRSEKLAAVGQLTASIAHEVNNPIAVMQGNLDVLRQQLDDNALRAVHSELRLLDEQVDRMRLIVTQLLQFARPGEYAGYITAVDTAQVLRDCGVLVGHLLSRSGIEVTRDLAATRRPAINRNELQQVLVNLLVNAIDAMPQGGSLRLHTRDVEPDSVQIEISDSGGGLDAELMNQLFQPFVTRKKDGTGLGLWISRSLVERYGGTLEARNRGDGISGAVFTLTLKREPDTV